MKNLRFSLLITLALMAIGVAGCAGGSGAGDTSELPSGGTSPSILSPSGDLEPGDDGTAEVDEDDDATTVPEDEDTAPAGRAIKCEFDKTVDTEVGKPYSQTLSASGGSGDFRFEATGLPAGLSLSSSGAISGTPTKAGKTKAGIEVIDIQSGEDEHCSLTITVTETIKVLASLESMIGVNKRVYKLTVNGTGDGSDYRWTFAPSANLCGSVNSGSWSGAACPPPPAAGTSVYIWMKSTAISFSETKVTATASSDASNAAKAEVTFPARNFEFNPGKFNPGFTLPDGGTAEGSAATGITIEFKTGWQERSGSNCTVGIEYSDKPGSGWAPLSPVTDDFDKNEKKVVSRTPPPGMTSNHKYFRITLKDESCGDHSGWNLQGLSIVVTYADESTYDYKSPCLYAWMSKGDSLRFGPKDTAVCAIVGTSGSKDDETDDTVYLLVEKKESEEFLAGSAWLNDRGETSIFLTETELDEIDTEAEAGNVKGDYHIMKMSSYKYNDFEQDDLTAYGDYAFDSDPFGNTIKLMKGEGSDSWVADSLEVFIFNPSTITKLTESTPQYSIHYGKAFGMNMNLDNDDDHALTATDDQALELTSKSDPGLLIPASDWTSIANQH